jgi:glycosyltransferase involved in cell wall biosynthesis
VRILYEMTYATRGQSGIPRDAKSLAQVLLNNQSVKTDFLLNPRSYTKKKRSSNQVSKWVSNELGDALRREPGRSAIPSVFISGLILLQSFSLRRTVFKLKLDEMQTANVFDFLKLKVDGDIKSNHSIFLLSISYLSRFARPSFLGPFRMGTKEYDFFIQQQADPMRVSKRTKHIVRLHDFLPISHPQFFDQNGVKVFSKSLRVMLKDQDKIWVMDSKQTAKDFKTNFGESLNVHVIPCVVKVKTQNEFNPLRKNQVCMVNTIEPRKRVGLAIAGFREAKTAGLIPEDWEFVIVGNEGWQEKSLVGNLKKQLFGSDIRFMEGAPDFELEKIYAESKILLSTSAAEGFGLPPLEGMAHGCFPVVSDIPQHRETVGEHGLFFEGDNPTNVARKLSEAVEIIEKSNVTSSANLVEYVKANYSEEVIANMWSTLIEVESN